VETLPAEQKQLFAVMVWSIWKHWNLKVWEDKTEVSATAVEGVMISDWQLANLSLPNARSAATAGSSVRVTSNSLEASSSAVNPVVWQKPRRAL
jgi:hypothetical protein